MIETIPRHLQPVRDPGPYPKGRACQCGCLLNTQNPGPRCHACQRKAMPDEELLDNVVELHPDQAA